MQKKIIHGLVALFFLSSLLLTGCNQMYRNPNATGAVVGAGIGAVIGAGMKSTTLSVLGGAAAGGILGAALMDVIISQESLLARLQKSGIQLIRVGEDIKIVIPSDRVFYPCSPNLDPAYFPTLNKLAMLLRSFNKVSMQMIAYTDNRGSMFRNLALTRKQAHNLGVYLWNQGVDTRLLSMDGAGMGNPIATNCTPRGRYLNRRVEIDLRQIIN